MDKPVQITRIRKSDYIGLIREYDRRKKLKIFEPQLPLERLSKFVASSVTAAAKTDPPDCLSCGVCCAFALIVPVRVDDTPRLKEYWDVTVDDIEDDVVIERVLPRDPETGHCIHLAGELGHEIGCRIYEDRPYLCHEFEVGSDRCHEYRRMYGIEQRLSEEQVLVELESLRTGLTGVITFASIVVDSVSTRMSMSIESPGELNTSRAYRMRIVGFLDDDEDTEYDIHEYDPDEETWFESDLIGITLEQAREFISARGKAAKSN